jgi:hypothetical protein
MALDLLFLLRNFMKFSSLLRAFVALLIFLTTAHSFASSTIIIDGNGKLIGLQNLSVAGKLYDVTVADGSCNSLFKGCDSALFNFSTWDEAVVAAESLIDGLAGQFDGKPNMVSGCENISQCHMAIPYSSYIYSGVPRYDAVSACIFDLGESGACGVSGPSAADTTPFDHITFAQFQLVSTPTVGVPEPTSILLMGLALVGLAFIHRRKPHTCCRALAIPAA